MTRFTTMTAVACLAATGTPAQDAGTDTVNPFCQTAFTPGDTNADGMIQPEEAVAMASGAYESIDLNSDGSLDRDEVGACVDAARTFLPLTAGSDAFDRYDIDDSGMIEQDEVLAMVEQSWGDEGPADTAAASGFVDIGKGMTEAMDDGSAAIAGAGMATDDAAADTTETADTGAGIADPAADATAEATADAGAAGTDETAVAGAEPAPETDPMESITLEEFAARTGQTYRLLDADRDQAISEAEYLARADELASIVEKQIDTLFGSLDTDASGDISRDEYLSAAEARMGLATQQAEAAGKLDPATGSLSVTTYYILR